MSVSENARVYAIGFSILAACVGGVLWFMTAVLDVDIVGLVTQGTTASPGGTSSAVSPVRSSDPHGEAPAPAATDEHPGADVVADAVAAALVTADTATDTSPADAVRRAAEWMTPELAAVLEASETNSGAGWWGELVQHNGSTTAMVEPAEDSGQPADTESTAFRVRWVERVPVGPNGWEGEAYGQTLFITMTRETPAAPWLVSDVTAG